MATMTACVVTERFLKSTLSLATHTPMPISVTPTTANSQPKMSTKVLLFFWHLARAFSLSTYMASPRKPCDPIIRSVW